MAILNNIVRFTISLASFSQVLLYLPLALDIGGKECMLALSLLLSTIFTIQATIHLLTRNTSFRIISTFFSFFQPFLIPALLLLTLNLYSSPSKPSLIPSSSKFISLWNFLSQTPSYWEFILKTSSPLFVILEGMSTLLCIQALSRFSTRRIERSQTPELVQLLCLIASAVVYVFSFYFLWESYDSVPDRIGATLIGVAVTSVLFLSGIGFASSKSNVVETSLVLGYAVFQIFHLSSRPEMYSAGLLQQVLKSSSNPPLPPLILQSLGAISSLISHIFGAGVEFFASAASALPLPVLVGLFYRIAVMYAASRIILALKRENEGYSSTTKGEDEESSSNKVMIVILITYSRLILIAVYTHLLLLSTTNNQAFWRWLNVFLTIALWGVELMIGGSEEGNWKEE